MTDSSAMSMNPRLIGRKLASFDVQHPVNGNFISQMCTRQLLRPFDC